MVTFEITVSESNAKRIEQRIRERGLTQPGEYIEALVRADAESRRNEVGEPAMVATAVKGE